MGMEKLSEDLVMEILSKLPMKPLLRSRSVCKSWYALIQNPTFISLHHNRAAAETNDCLLVKRYLNGGGGDGDSDGDDSDIVLSFVTDDTPVDDIDISFTGLDVSDLQVLGPCNGVVCLTRLGRPSTVVLCNPSMREFRVLPEPAKKVYIGNLGFGFDCLTNDYKVVLFGIEDPDSDNSSIDNTIEIYDFSSDSWREIEAEVPDGFLCHYSYCTSWNGDFYWYASRNGGGEAIVVFRMSDEVFEEMPVPDVCMLDDCRERKLFVLNGSLALVLNPAWIQSGEFMLGKCFHIWVMKEDDIEVSWTKHFTIGPLDGIDWALGFRGSGEFLLESWSGQMMAFNLDTREMKEYQVYGRPPSSLQVLRYTESLVSVKRQ